MDKRGFTERGGEERKTERDRHRRDGEDEGKVRHAGTRELRDDRWRKEDVEMMKGVPRSYQKDRNKFIETQVENVERSKGDVRKEQPIWSLSQPNKYSQAWSR